MKFAIFDGILETHVASSLERALVSRGHEVLNTGKFGRGFEFASDPQLLATISREIDRVVAYAPDVVFVFRPASLPVQYLKRLKKTGAQLMAWFSDDPVLWKLSYGPVLDHYDHVLHCGTSTVLAFYEERHNRPTGINFPFWTDQTAFPKVYGDRAPEFDALFLGNVHDQVRRKRYFDLASLDTSVRIHGNVGQDYYNMWGGYLDSDSEVIDAGSRAKFAINIPQFFKDHEGLPTWFDGLADLGYFQYPSRVIQYAAMGLPIISVVPSASDVTSFPEITCVSSVEAIDLAARELMDSDLKELSNATYARFNMHYSARARVLAIEQLLIDDSWKNLSAVDRANWFTNFDGSSTDYEAQKQAMHLDGSRATLELSTSHSLCNGTIRTSEDLENSWNTLLRNIPSISKKNVVVIGTGWTSETSQLWTVIRALRELGNDVSEGNPYNIKQFISRDPFAEYTGIVDVPSLINSTKKRIDLVIFVGDDYIPSVASKKYTEVHSIKMLNIGNTANGYSNRVARLSVLMDLVSFVNINALSNMRMYEIENVRHDPEMFDAAFVRALQETSFVFKGVTVLAQKGLHLANDRALLSEFEEFEHRELVAQDVPSLTLREMAARLRSTMLFVLPDTGRPGPLANPYLGHALISGALVVLPRTINRSTNVFSGEQVLAFRGAGELSMKLSRLADSKSMFYEMIGAASALAREKFLAEQALAEIFGRLFDTPDALERRTVDTFEDLRMDVNKRNDRSSKVPLLTKIRRATRIRTRIRKFLS